MTNYQGSNFVCKIQSNQSPILYQLKTGTARFAFPDTLRLASRFRKKALNIVKMGEKFQKCPISRNFTGWLANGIIGPSQVSGPVAYGIMEVLAG
jgi:hypothetical protein